MTKGFDELFNKKKALYQSRMGEVSDDYIWEEIAADVGGDLFVNDEFISRITAEKPTLARRAMEFFRDLLERIRGNRRYSELSGDTIDYMRDVSKVAQKYEQAFVKARESAAVSSESRYMFAGKNAANNKANTNITYLSDSDIEEYMQAGNTHTRNVKRKMSENGEYSILVSKEDTDDFIDKALTRENESQIKAFSKANDRLVKDIFDMSKGKVDVTGYYMELNSDDIHHTDLEHGSETEAEQISLSEDEIKNIPEYMVNYDNLLKVEVKKDGRKRIVLGKKINGHSIIINVVSKGRKALIFKSAYVLSTDKYNEKFGNKKRNAEYRKATASNNETMPRTSETVPASAFPNDIVSQENTVVKAEGTELENVKHSLSDDEETPVSRFRTNTIERATMFTPEDLEAISPTEFEYIPERDLNIIFSLLGFDKLIASYAIILSTTTQIRIE